jgi:hypothetical protein
MIDLQAIKPYMPVVCSKGNQFAVVDHMEGRDYVKLSKDADGRHHYIPTEWISSVDEAVHLDRPGDRAMSEWITDPRDAVARGVPHAGEEENPTGAERVRSQQTVDPELDPERAERLKR